MKWKDYDSYIEIYPPKEFNYEECFVFLSRSNEEILHQMQEGYILKLIKSNEELILLKIGSSDDKILVLFPMNTPTTTQREKAARFIWEWFDLDRDLAEFYELATRDNVLHQLCYQHYGLRIMCIPDLFEALTWAIIGQQINLTFAYALKKRLVEQYGESVSYEGNVYWLYPTFEKIATLEIDDLREYQFSVRKSEYVIGIAKCMLQEELSKQDLMKMKDFQQVHKFLVSIRGIGPWTADYVMMKCLHYPSAFPITDVGLHNALKVQLGMERKPTIEEINKIALNWEGWQAYATFYLWRSLYGKIK